MLGLSNQEMTKLLVQAVVFGVIWAVMFFFVRKGMNKRNFVTDPEAKRESFKWDAIYGGLAAFLSVIVKQFASKYVDRLV